MKFAHIADVHIKNLKYHDIYQDVFQQLYKKLEEEKVNKIIICGDIAHTKTNISPEFVQIAGQFFKNLADIAPLYIILGNHDGNLKNLDRQDAITPIVEALNNPDIHLLKNSGEVHLDDKFALNVLSIFDRDNWKKPSSPEKINIALYHGAIEGSKTDTGWAMKDTDDSVSIFDDFDYAFLGDIHKRQFLKWRIAYCGSLIQQNFGEEEDKGLIIWDIQEKDVFKTKKINFKNPNPFITIQYEEGKDFYAPSNSYLRIVLDKFYTRDQIETIKDKFSVDFSPKYIVVVDNHAKDIENKVEEGDSTKLNLRDNNTQQELIKEYLEADNISEDLMNQVLEINTKYNLEAEVSDDIARNVKWSLESFAWDNLFNYKEGNKIDFCDLNGIVGIFGKNYSGKSSIIDGLLYTLFNTTSKKIRKNFDIVNERKKQGSGKIVVKVADGYFIIDRDTEKNTKKSKGKLVEEGKTNVNFEFVSNGANFLPFNGDDRNETDKNIRKEIGTYEDFCNTSLSTQHGSLDFINEGSTRRKEILANFLDLQIFENKHKPANQYANELKALIKKLGGKEYSKLLGDVNIKHQIAINKQAEAQEELKGLKDQQNHLQDKIVKLNADLAKVEEPIDIEKAWAIHGELNSQLFLAKSAIENKSAELIEQESIIEKIKQVIEKLNVEELKVKQEASKKILKEIDSLLYEKKTKNNSLSIYKKSSQLIDMAACGKDQYKECSFKKNAYDSLEEISIIDLALKAIEEQYVNLRDDLLKLDMDKVDEYLDKVSKLNEKSSEASKKVSKLLKEIVELQKTKADVESELVSNEKIINRYEANKEIYDNAKEIKDNRDKLLVRKNFFIKCIEETEKSFNMVIKETAALEQQIKTYETEVEELSKLNKEYSAYELFLKAVHNNGIPFELIKRTLPIINEEMNKLLHNIVEFEAYFENEDGKLEIYIKHPNSSVRSIENCSGAEKSLVAMAIRLALIKCGSLPVSDVFILDEPATSLDAEHLESFIKVLEMIKTQFKTVLLITHLDTLKDSVDKIIEIQKDEEGFAYIN
jgi:DNA repair exonuclease SbcCD ATPase subunit/predicted phosphodiesterase